MNRSHRVTGLALLAAIVTAVSILAATAVASGKREQAKYDLKLGFVTTLAHPYGVSLTQYKSLVESATNGDVSITLNPSYGGGDDVQLLNDIGTGTVSGGAVSAAVLPNAGIKNFIPLQLPFLVDSYQLESRLITNSSGVAQRMIQGMARNAKTLVPVGIFEGGMRQFAFPRAITSLADLKGAKIRAVPSKFMTDTMTALGAAPQAIPVGEVPTALKNKVVEGAEANSGLVFANQWDRSGANRISEVNLWPFPAVVMFNKSAFNALPADIQQVLRDKAKDLAAFSLTVVGNSNRFPALLCARGTRYSAVPAAERAGMVKATKSVITKYTTGSYRTLAPIVASINALKTRVKGALPTDTPPASCIDGPGSRYLQAAPPA